MEPCAASRAHPSVTRVTNKQGSACNAFQGCGVGLVMNHAIKTVRYVIDIRGNASVFAQILIFMETIVPPLAPSTAMVVTERQGCVSSVPPTSAGSTAMRYVRPAQDRHATRHLVKSVSHSHGNADHTLVIVMGTIAGASTLLLLVLGFWAHKRNRLMCVSSSNTGGGRWDSNGSRQSRNSDYQSHKYSEIYDKDLDTDSCLPGPSPPRLSVQPPLPPLHPKHDPRQESPKPRSWSLGQGTSRDFRSSFVSAHKDSHMTSGNEPSLVTSEMSGVSNIASSPIKDLARSPSMPVLMTTDVASGSTHQYIPHSCDIHDRPVSSSTLGLPTKTSSILFIEQNNDLSNITVKYITPDETVQGK
ncbi:uncharacterized protein LOC124289767 isoform X4 [Haliotis rubra]|uniref:uncharacterized protein LOC124289767 isoform X4 n=1 Tax=Haliotis rubra TaxID=36100 RepID=UPI001EE59E38|nr:uncharacterized protein LOC124289767 isoform X4 [Haliotis rubra]